MAHEIKSEWEKVTKSLPRLYEGFRHHQVWRLEVPGGWLYKQNNDTPVFIPKPNNGDF